nr:hypothetical protein [uncultured Faecalimonas sp.]
MKITQVIKKLNNTELGKARTNDTYVLIPKNLDISDLFPAVNKQIGFINKENGEIINLRYTMGREKRVVGLGPYYNKYSVCAGDEIVLERQIVKGESQYFINLKKRLNVVILKRQKSGFEVLTKDRINLLDSVSSNVGGERLKLIYLCSEKKRTDSPELTEFYDFLSGERSMLGDFSSGEFIEIEVKNDIARVKRFCTWRKYKFEMEDEDA